MVLPIAGETKNFRRPPSNHHYHTTIPCNNKFTLIDVLARFTKQPVRTAYYTVALVYLVVCVRLVSVALCSCDTPSETNHKKQRIREPNNLSLQFIMWFVILQRFVSLRAINCFQILLLRFSRDLFIFPSENSVVYRVSPDVRLKK